jgi:hypothetical protein
VDWDLDIIPIPQGVGFGVNGSYAGTIGHVTAVESNIVGPSGGISGGHVAVSTDRDLGWLAPADTAYTGEPAALRVFRLCREQGIPVVVDGIYSFVWNTDQEAGARTMGPQLPVPLVTLLEQCAAVDRGVLGESRELLGLTYRSGHSLHNQTPVATVSPIQPFNPTDDDQHLVNDMTVTRDRGSSARVVDEDSVADQGLHQDSRSINCHGDWQAADHASWEVHEATWPQMHYPQVAFELAKASAPVDEWLATNLGDQLEATDLPAEHPGTEVAQLLDGFTETIAPYSWGVKANGSPTGPWEVGVLGDDALGKLDSAGTTLFNDYDEDDTLLGVSVNTGPVWSTDAGEVPFDIDIGGEQMTVTQVALFLGAVYLFSVTRSVNGVVKSHEAGAVVSLWRPTVLALEGL